MPDSEKTANEFMKFGKQGAAYGGGTAEVHPAQKWDKDEWQETPAKPSSGSPGQSTQEKGHGVMKIKTNS